MCYLLFAKKLKKTAKNKTILDILDDKMLYNKDGYCYLDNNGNEIRTLDQKEYIKNIKKDLKASDWIISHLRFATNGSKTTDNVHLFEQNGYRFAHNGIISHFSDWKKGQVKSDSLLYFESLINSLKCNDENHIVKRIKKSNFFNGGRAFLLSPDNKMYIYGDFHIYIVNDWLIISSTTIDIQAEKTVKLGDISLMKDSCYQDYIQGIYILKPSNKKIDFTLKGEMPKKQYQDTIGFKTDYRYSYNDDYSQKSLYNYNKDLGF